jgi:hypothetical protein
MNLSRAVAAALIAGAILTVASLVVGRSLTDDGNPPYLRGAPAAYLVDVAGAEVGEADLDVIIPERPKLGAVHLVPAFYDWTVWSLLVAAPMGAYYLIVRRRPSGQRLSTAPAQKR